MSISSATSSTEAAKAKAAISTMQRLGGKFIIKFTVLIAGVNKVLKVLCRRPYNLIFISCSPLGGDFAVHLNQVQGSNYSVVFYELSEPDFN